MKRMNVWLLLGLIGTVVFGSQFAVQYGRTVLSKQTHWWTPSTKPISLAGSEDDFELFIEDKLLQTHIQEGRLLLGDEEKGLRRVEKADVGVRLNNWHKVKAALLHVTVFLALFLGMSIMCLIAGFAEILRRRRSEKGQRDVVNTPPNDHTEQNTSPP